MDKKKYKCPNIEDKEDFKAPPSAGMDTTAERISRQMAEVIASTMYAETLPMETGNKLAKKFNRDEKENCKDEK